MYRSRWEPDQYLSLRVTTVRWFTLVALVGYPAGALLFALNDKGSPLSLLGGFLAPICAVTGFLVLWSRTQRITQAKPAELDEFELQMRHRAMSKAYGIFSALITLVVLYLMLAPDWGGWMPTSRDHWRGLFWGAILYSALLPTATLVWSPEFSGPVLDDEEEQA